MTGIGVLLRETRESSGVSLEEASQDLGIKSAILNNIEEGNIGCFKDIFELKSLIQAYAKYLGLDSEELTDQFNDFLFETTSKIPVEEIEKEMLEKQKEEANETRIQSPYTDTTSRYHNKKHIFLYVVIALVIALIVFWAISLMTVGNSVSTVAYYVG